MMKKNSFLLVLLLVSGLLFNFLFWDEKLGLNYLLFAAWLLGGAFLLQNKPQASLKTWLAVAGAVLAGSIMLIQNSSLSKITFLGSLMIAISLIFQPKLRSVASAIAVFFTNFFQAPDTLVKVLSSPEKSTKKPSKPIFWHWLGLAGIPLLILFVFLWLFSIASPRFATFTEGVWKGIDAFLANFFAVFSFWRLLFIGLGIVLAIGSWMFSRKNAAAAWDLSQSNEMQRKRWVKPWNRSPLGLKREALIGAMAVISVNLLALFYNIIDINWIWFNFEASEIENLSQLVHEGTYVLIFSILLSMAIMLYYFRGNQHFYKKNKALRWGSYLWILQNIVMVISVGLRNKHYIMEMGLAYKRIGVILFLLLTLFGLVTLFIKIAQNKSLYYLLRLNTLATYLLFLAASTANWDKQIARYNLQHFDGGALDTEFLLHLSDKALPELDQHREKFTLTSRFILDKRIEEFMEAWEGRSLLSWNKADANAYQYFKESGREKGLDLNTK